MAPGAADWEPRGSAESLGADGRLHPPQDSAAADGVLIDALMLVDAQT
jgi:hypothetical protein